MGGAAVALAAATGPLPHRILLPSARAVWWLGRWRCVPHVVPCTIQTRAGRCMGSGFTSPAPPLPAPPGAPPSTTAALAHTPTTPLCRARCVTAACTRLSTATRPRCACFARMARVPAPPATAAPRAPRATPAATLVSPRSRAQLAGGRLSAPRSARRAPLAACASIPPCRQCRAPWEPTRTLWRARTVRRVPLDTPVWIRPSPPPRAPRARSALRWAAAPHPPCSSPLACVYERVCLCARLCE